MPTLWALVICLGVTDQCTTTANLSAFPSFQKCEEFRTFAERLADRLLGHAKNASMPSHCELAKGAET